MRLLRLMEGSIHKALFDTIIGTLPAVFNISALLFLMMYIYAIMGMQLFAKVQFYKSYDGHANFRSFGSSLLSLLRFATGESWNGLMYDAATATSGCVSDPSYNFRILWIQ